MLIIQTFNEGNTMKNRIIETLNKLMLIHGSSGYEQSIVTELRNRFKTIILRQLKMFKEIAQVSKMV